MMNDDSANCWYGIFLDAYKYSSNYLLATVTIIITSVVMVWLYEKPNFYKLIFKISKHSNILSPVQSDEVFDANYNQSFMDDIPGVLEEKSNELTKDEIEFEKEPIII